MSAVADVRPALIGHLKELHLPTVRQCYEETARREFEVALHDVEHDCRSCTKDAKTIMMRAIVQSALGNQPKPEHSP